MDEAKASPSQPEVAFHNVATRYLPGTPVECHYSLTTHFAWTPKDWIGLFKVGWRSVRDYHTFVWSVSPQGQRGRSPLNCCVRFEASYLPPPGPSVYQFSYVAGNGTLRGSSPHFTFSSPEPQDELVTLEGPDCNPDMVLVVTKSSLLETQLAESERNRGDLTRLQKETEIEVRELEGRIWELEALAEKWRNENSKLLGRCESLTEEEREVRKECQLVKKRLLDSTARIQDLEGQVKSISQTLLERESTLDRVRDRVKTMSTQQEELGRQAQEDSEERQLFEAQVESLKREGRNLRTTLAERDAELDALKTEVQRLQHQISMASKDKLKYEAVSEQLLSSRQEVALMGEEMARAASVRDRTISDLHRSRLQASELEVKLAQLSGRWEESEERWQEERTSLRLKSEVEKEKVLRLSAELLRWKASAQERESETECLRQELGRERDHNRVQLSEMVRERKEMKSVLAVTQKEKEILQREKRELQEYAKILEQNLEQREREKERENPPQPEHGTTADAALGARASADRETQQGRAPSEVTRSPLTRQQSDRVVISQPLSIASQLAEAQSEIVEAPSLEHSTSTSSQTESPRSPRESVTRPTDPKPAERFEGGLEEVLEVDDSWRECPICKQRFPDGCGQEVLEHHIDSHIFFSTNDPFTFE